MLRDASGDRSRATYGEVFGTAGFSAIYAAHLLSMLGDALAGVSIAVLVYERTASPLLSAITFSLAFVPQLLALVILPRLVGRVDARRTLVACHLGSAVLVGVLAVPGMPLPVLFVLLGLVGVIAPIFGGIRAALLPEIFGVGPQLVLARALMRMVVQGSLVFGSLLGAALLTVVSPNVALTIDAVSFGLSALLIGRSAARPGTRAPAPPPRRAPPRLRETWRHPALRLAVAMSWVLPACAVAPEALATPYTRLVGAPLATAGVLLAAMPVGSFIAQLLGGRVLSTAAQRRILVPAVTVGSLALLAFAARPGFLAACALMVLCGLSSVYMTAIDQIIIEHAGDLLPNVLALQGPLVLATQGIAFALWGAAAEWMPLPTVIALAGGISLLLLLLCCAAGARPSTTPAANAPR